MSLNAPLRYLIGKDGVSAPELGSDAVTEVGYDAGPAPKTGHTYIKYCNLFDEENTGKYGPYLHTSDTAADYNEGQIDPKGPGWNKNLDEQFNRAISQGYEYIELDNPDAYSMVDVLAAVARAESRGLKVIAKNPLICNGSSVQYLAHPNVYGVIVEKDAGTPVQMDKLRRDAGKSNIPIWFVAFDRVRKGTGWGWAQEMAKQGRDLLRVGVTYSAEGEYTNSVGVLPYNTGDPTMSWRVAKSLLTLRDQVNAVHPARSKTDDGTIGDERHAATESDHNPDRNGVVRALDLTHDPAHGFNSYDFAEMLRQKKDPRIKYVISNHRIWSATVAPYQWRGYIGSNPHDRHVHISVVPDNRADDTKPWDIGAVIPVDTHPVPPQPIPPPADRFNTLVQRLLVHEGGNDDDPRDIGGRTSRGITQTEYNEWRKTHSGLPSDVWNAPQQTVLDIYRQNYWHASRSDEMPKGVDYALFDYSVNSGLRKAAKGLQEVVGANPDGWIGPITMEAVKLHKPSEIIDGISAERMAYLRHRPNWETYKNGWTKRVADVRRDAGGDVA